ncbi:triple QxxK/R motif-containing protein isoform X2 [Scyliorhinus canicula]|uniref:triple QxxK/R motif-containing protein isoform X2 n=1 Tax=Scyliorhinus canicula TaxID=7830 RepID=UPI0018F63293|nr:triple QxxK/R motif-containing protein isoform X2 [Scyliorhinus canicula]
MQSIKLKTNRKRDGTAGEPSTLTLIIPPLRSYRCLEERRDAMPEERMNRTSQRRGGIGMIARTNIRGEEETGRCFQRRELLRSSLEEQRTEHAQIAFSSRRDRRGSVPSFRGTEYILSALNQLSNSTLYYKCYMSHAPLINN